MSATALQAIRSFLMGDADFRAVFGNRIFHSVLPEANVNLPAAVITILSGRHDVYMPVSDISVLIKCFAPTINEAENCQIVIDRILNAKNNIVLYGSEILKNPNFDTTDLTRPVVFPQWDNSGATDGFGWSAVDIGGGLGQGAFITNTLSGPADRAVLRSRPYQIRDLVAGRSYRLEWVVSKEGSVSGEFGFLAKAFNHGTDFDVPGTIVQLEEDSAVESSLKGELVFAVPANASLSLNTPVSVEFQGWMYAGAGTDLLKLSNVSLREFRGVILSSENRLAGQGFFERTTGLAYFQSVYRMLVRTEDRILSS
jgi:hypothetical protein